MHQPGQRLRKLWRQIEEGGRLLKHGDIGLAGVHVCAENEVELIAGIGTGLFNSASVTAHLRLREGLDDAELRRTGRGRDSGASGE